LSPQEQLIAIAIDFWAGRLGSLVTPQLQMPPNVARKRFNLLVPGERIELPTNGLQKIDRAILGASSHDLSVGLFLEICYFL
jgi:hypothetical protein